jgi:putative oxygen-independent coproporphyrinogen III oxidase
MEGKSMPEISFKERLDDFWVFPKLSRVQNARAYEDDFFTFLEQKQPVKEPTNLYIHIPFCDSGCVFCPYYKLHGHSNYKDNLKGYVDAIVYEIQKYASTPYLKDRKIESVHFGGGNPFLLSISDLQRIVDTIKQCFQVEVNDNWTMEGSINSIKSEEYVKGLLSLGINRISFGIQTFKEDVRKAMNIKSTVAEIYKGVALLNKAGLTAYCIDMMYNMPDQSLEDFFEDLEKVTALNPYHIDIYNMAVFPNTYIDKLIHKEGHFKIKPSNENQMHMFREGDKWLFEHGYKQIITNTYSRVQKDVHIGDKIYLNNGNVIGIGVSARGYIDGYAYKNVCEIKQYMELISKNQFPADLACHCTEEQHQDRKMVYFPILMEIKKCEIPDYERYEERIDQIIQLGLAKWENDILKLTKEGIFWSGNVASLFIGEERWKSYIRSFILAAKEKINPYNEDYMGKEVVSLED